MVNVQQLCGGRCAWIKNSFERKSAKHNSGGQYTFFQLKAEKAELMKVSSRGSVPNVKPLLVVVTTVQEPQPVTHT